MSVRRILIAAGGAVAVAALIVLFHHDPSVHTFYPRCLFHALTGLQCPGCGATRALYHLLHGEIHDALRFNALFVLLLPGLTIGGAMEAMAAWNGRGTNLMHRPWIGWTVAFLLVSWGVLRNL